MPKAPHSLRVEHACEPIGILVEEPRLSWQLPDGATRQTAYRITTDNGWDTGWVVTDRQLLVEYAGPALSSAERVQWQVEVETDLGRSEISDAGWFELGLMNPTDWHATWIEPGLMPDGPSGERAAVLLRDEFTVSGPVTRARLYATAQGLYELYLNGTRVGRDELTPGFTQYDSHLQVQAYDITDAIRPGPNSIGAILADGWFRGQTGVARASEQWGDRVALLAQIMLFDDSATTVNGTGPDWRSTTGHILSADLIAGERWDLNRLPRGWTDAGYPDNDWDEVVAVDHGFGGLVDSPAPAVRQIQEIVPLSVTRLVGGGQLVDLGQNINGWIRLSSLGPAGTTLTLTHGEWLAPDGDLTVENLRPNLPFLPEPLSAGQVDVVVSAGVAGDIFEPRRTTHGFQYVRIDGHPSELSIDDVRGIVVHTDLRRTGWFSCSDERLNRLHESAVWSLRDNACDIPTDCPHRERAGWTGDWQLFVPTASFLFDVAGFSAKWLRDVAVDQWPDGTIANISPSTRFDGINGPLASLNGSAGWGDAAVLVPWEIYQATGDMRLLASMWPTMTRWLGRTERLAREQRHSSRASARPTPASHEEYLWDSGFHWGEWLAPGDDMQDDLGTFATADKGDVATAYYAYSAAKMAQIAALLGRDADAQRYRDLAVAARGAWQAEYLGPDGQVTPDTQANHVRALAFGLVPDAHKSAVAQRLIELIRKTDTHLGTGFLATPYLLPVLADNGYPDVAYQLLFQDTTPSWLVMVDRGSTTVWEDWNGVDEDGVPHDSLNHYSKGAVVSFLHRYTAGIQLLEAGYRRFRVQPRPGGGLTHAESAHESPYGRIESAWGIEDTTFELHVVVPAGTEALVVLPDDTTSTAGPGQHMFTCQLAQEEKSA